MASAKTPLKDTVARVQSEIKALLAEVRAGNLDKKKLAAGLKEVEKDLKVVDIHVHKHEP